MVSVVSLILEITGLNQNNEQLRKDIVVDTIRFHGSKRVNKIPAKTLQILLYN